MDRQKLVLLLAVVILAGTASLVAAQSVPMELPRFFGHLTTCNRAA